MGRLIRDAKLKVTTAFAAAGAAANSTSFDLVGSTFAQERVEMEIAIPALANLVDAKTIIVKLQDSADNVTFADVDPLIQTTVTGAGGVGCAAKTVALRLPSQTRRYIRFVATTLAAGGDSTASSAVYSLLT